MDLRWDLVAQDGLSTCLQAPHVHTACSSGGETRVNQNQRVIQDQSQQVGLESIGDLEYGSFRFRTSSRSRHGDPVLDTLTMLVGSCSHGAVDLDMGDCRFGLPGGPKAAAGLQVGGTAVPVQCVPQPHITRRITARSESVIYWFIGNHDHEDKGGQVSPDLNLFCCSVCRAGYITIAINRINRIIACKISIAHRLMSHI